MPVDTSEWGSRPARAECGVTDAGIRYGEPVGDAGSVKFNTTGT